MVHFLDRRYQIGPYLFRGATSDRVIYIGHTRKILITPADAKDHFKKVIADHEQLITCLKKRDTQAAINTITDHIRLFHSRVAKYLLPSIENMDVFRGEYLKSA